METAVCEDLSLTQMRLNCGWTLAEAGKRLASEMGKKLPYTHARMSQIENDGTDSTEQQEALATIYAQSFDAVRSAVKKLRK